MLKMSLPQLMCSPPDYPSIKVNVDAVVRGSFAVASTIFRDFNSDVKGVVNRIVQVKAFAAMHSIQEAYQ